MVLKRAFVTQIISQGLHLFQKLYSHNDTIFDIKIRLNLEHGFVFDEIIDILNLWNQKGASNSTTWDWVKF